MFKKVDKLILRGSEWLRATGRIGKGTGKDSYYLAQLFKKSSGRMCCIGVLGRACGLPVRLLSGLGTPRSVVNRILNTDSDTEFLEDAHQYRDLVDGDSCGANFYVANDDKSTSDDEKIDLLTPLFADIGIDLEFRPNE